MPITISLLEGSPRDATVHNSVLLWNVKTNKTTHFYFRSTDACQASSTFNITVTVNSCSCQNNGKCVPQTPRGQGSYLCDCAPGYAGMNCSTEINECDSYPCFRGKWLFFHAQPVPFFLSSSFQWFSQLLQTTSEAWNKGMFWFGPKCHTHIIFTGQDYHHRFLYIIIIDNC